MIPKRMAGVRSSRKETRIVNRMKNLCMSLLAVVFFAVPSRADVKLPAIFGDHMVLQQGSSLPVWGWADAGEKVTVSAVGQRVSTTAGADGKWMVKLDPIQASAKPIELTVSGKNAVTFKDVLVGEVWVCSGQSNMVWPLNATFTAKTEGPRANHPQLRLFKVGHKVAFEPQADCEGKWELCTPESASQFSGVGYYFGRELHQKLGIPVGMIGSYCSATPAQSWTSIEGLRSQGPLKEFADGFEKLKATRVQIEEEYANKVLPAWESQQKQWEQECRIPYEKACKEWEEQVKKAKAEGQPLPPKPQLTQQAPHKAECRTARADNAAVLYNGMIAPLIPFAIKGAIWYQGESNANNPPLYRTLFPTMIADWRKYWGRGDFPFLFVQLCAGAGDDVQMPLMREAQASALALPNTGMAVIIDAGEPKFPRLHPRNKRDVGLRLALMARHVAYGEALVYSGPAYKGMEAQGGKVNLSFNHIGGGLVIGAAPNPMDGGEPNVPDTILKGFAISGADRKFVPAQAKIEGDRVVVWSDQVPQPVAVRYDWKSFPDGNLYNKEQLPAVPFRTDDWNN